MSGPLLLADSGGATGSLRRAGSAAGPDDSWESSDGFGPASRCTRGSWILCAPGWIISR